ncbi:MAG TPA: CcdC protein domain-containing protein, partial [Pseudogracilibacillus sp.]|nr:CcdC protein domain-containing protein [Pseudogracilibacillus sp.]
MATTMILVRLRASKKPTSVKKIILPPIFMSSGALMFLSPMFRLSWIEVGEAVVVGLLFSILL